MTPDERRMAMDYTIDGDVHVREDERGHFIPEHMALRDWMGMPHAARKATVERVARKYGYEGHYPPPLTKTQIMVWAREAIIARKGV